MTKNGMNEAAEFQVGIVSDTHGLVRPEVLDALRGSELILHAGDVGGQEVLTLLGTVAPVVAVRGNTDGGGWAGKLQHTQLITHRGISFYILHHAADIDIDPKAAGVSVVVSGHTHTPKILKNNGVLFINPGSAGPRRFRHPVSVGLLEVKDGKLDPRIVVLDE
jgi:uncharacterized protein